MKTLNTCLIVGMALAMPVAAFAQSNTADATYCTELSHKYQKYVSSDQDQRPPPPNSSQLLVGHNDIPAAEQPIGPEIEATILAAFDCVPEQKVDVSHVCLQRTGPLGLASSPLSLQDLGDRFQNATAFWFPTVCAQLHQQQAGNRKVRNILY